jgi:hypothetical protein
MQFWGRGQCHQKMLMSQRHWRKLAMEARAVSDELTDPDAKWIMLRIAGDRAEICELYGAESH